MICCAHVGCITFNFYFVCTYIAQLFYGATFMFIYRLEVDKIFDACKVKLYLFFGSLLNSEDLVFLFYVTEQNMYKVSVIV